MSLKVAVKLSILIMQLISKLDQSVAFVCDHCTKDEFEAFCKEAAKIINAIDFEIAGQIYKQHPSLRPEALDGP